jgi:large subunit ribosomal protein L31
MKADIHPKYNDVVFQDVTSNFAFLTRSTLTSKDKIKWEDGNEYPLVKVKSPRLRTRSIPASRS